MRFRQGVIAHYLLKLQARTTLQHQKWKLELARDLRKNTRALYPRWFDPFGTEGEKVSSR